MRLADLDRVSEGIAVLTNVNRIYRVTRYILETSGQMTATRITDKLKAAAGVVQRASEDIEKRADDLIAREGDIKKKTEAAFAPHHAHLDAMHRGLDDLENELRQLSNMASDETPGAEQVPLRKSGA